MKMKGQPLRFSSVICLFLVLIAQSLTVDTAPLVVSNFLPAASSLLSKHSNSNNNVSMGTTLVALCCKNGVVVGADTRTSVSGFVSNRFAHKLTPLSDSIVVCRSGSAADTQALCDEAKVELESLQYTHNRVLLPSQVAKLLRWYMVNNENGGKEDLQASLLCAGINSATNKGELYAILPSGALLQHDVYAVSGSGSTYIMGFLDEQLMATRLEEDEMLDEQDAIAIVGKAIELAMDRDGSSGGFVRMYSITVEGRRSITIYPSERRKDGGADGKINGRETNASSVELPGFAPPSS